MSFKNHSRRFFARKMLQRLLIGAVCLGVLAFLLACQRSLSRTAEKPIEVFSFSPEIRIALTVTGGEVVLKAGNAPVRVLDENELERGCLPAGEETRVKIQPTGFSLEVLGLINVTSIRFDSLSLGSALRLNNVELSHQLFFFLRGTKNEPTVVAKMCLEEYLPGVLAGEVPDYWPKEALKAQAVAARSYALQRMKINKSAKFDVFADERSQMFVPERRGNAVMRSVVSETRGETMVTPTGKVFPAYYHSTCGGATVPGKYVFPNDLIPADSPLKSVRCGYCGKSPLHRWTARLDKALISERLQKHFGDAKKVGKVLGLEFFDDGGGSLRWRKVRVITDKGTFEMEAAVFRLAVGSSYLKSAMIISVVDVDKFIELCGGGFGHGVGMCQYGACGAAEAGLKYKEILRLYYSGVQFAVPYR